MGEGQKCVVLCLNVTEIAADSSTGTSASLVSMIKLL